MSNRRSKTLYGVSREDVVDGFSVKVEELAGGITYVGKAEVGSLSSNPVWKIMKITESSGTTDVEYADGNDYFDNIWDNRASLNYS